MILRVVLVLCFSAWAVMAIYPWRLKVKEDWAINNYANKMSAEEYRAKFEYDKTKSLPLSDERRLTAMENMADVDARLLKQDEAETIMSDVWKARDDQRQARDLQNPSLKVRDEKFCQTMLRTAAIKRDKGNIEDAVKNYDTILWYDSTYPGPKAEQDIARDLNNLGVIYYMKGLGAPKKVDGIADYEKSIKFYEDALAKYRQLYGKDSQYEANALYNEVLPLREVGRLDDSKKAKAEADRIASLVKRPCALP